MQKLVDQAGLFNLFSVPASTGSGVAIQGAGGVTGVHVKESLHRFRVSTQAPTASTPTRSSNAVGEAIGAFDHRWMIIPDDFVALPDKEPPATTLDPSRSQRFAMLDGICTFGDDGFRGFGTGTTFPTTINGQSQLLAAAVGTIVEGFGKFKDHLGTYVYCGTLNPDHGFTGSLLLRVMDLQQTLQTKRSLPTLKQQPGPEAGITYALLRGEAVPSDPVKPNIGPDGNPIGLIVQQGLRLQSMDAAISRRNGVQTTDSVGELVGDAVDDFVFKNSAGEVIGKFVADTSDGRVFNVKVAGQPGIRFGGVGRILKGEGPFAGIEGLMTDDSVVLFEPHISASVYILRIHDPQGKFQAALGG